MHDANGLALAKGDKVVIEATITDIYPFEDYTNATVETTHGRRPDGAPDRIHINTGVMVRVNDGDPVPKPLQQWQEATIAVDLAQPAQLEPVS